ncbi:MAG: hypothetical protein OIF34_13385, partial [Porticoccaceae bacterium]|nr:hypothetical protein [Porticoccaceae bacterium]
MPAIEIDLFGAPLMKNLLIAVVALVALNGTAVADTDFAKSLVGFETTTIGFVLSQDELSAELKAEALKNATDSIQLSLDSNKSIAQQ